MIKFSDYAHGAPYTGIGSRETPEEILLIMRQLAARLARVGYILRSGAAEGADSAFEAGARDADGSMEIYLPWKGFNQNGSAFTSPSLEASQLASRIHPAWPNLSHGARKLHARNAHQVLGIGLKTPSAFVVCWTRDMAICRDECSSATGGTGTAIKIASDHGIPVLNMARPSNLEFLLDYLGETAPQRERQEA